VSANRKQGDYLCSPHWTWGIHCLKWTYFFLCIGILQGIIRDLYIVIHLLLLYLCAKSILSLFSYIYTSKYNFIHTSISNDSITFYLCIIYSLWAYVASMWFQEDECQARSVSCVSLNVCLFGKYMNNTNYSIPNTFSNKMTTNSNEYYLLLWKKNMWCCRGITITPQKYLY
jgi:hypothetical protein